MTAGVYVIHFEIKLHHAQHYIGYSPDIEERLRKHRAGNGARLMEVVTAAGIGWRLATIFPDADREFERKLKNWHGGAKACPICRRQAQMTLWELLDPGFAGHTAGYGIVWDAVEPIPFN